MLDFLIHGANSIGMLLEIAVVASPTCYTHGIYPVAVTAIYFLCALIWILIGADLYAFLAAACYISGIFGCHVAACFLQRLRQSIHKNFFSASFSRQIEENQ